MEQNLSSTRTNKELAKPPPHGCGDGDSGGAPATQSQVAARMPCVVGEQDSRIRRAAESGRCALLPVVFLLRALWPLVLLPPGCLAINAEIPLVSEHVPASPSHRNEPGCLQDGHHYRFEEKWSPVLIPRGTMHCVKCECLTVEKKGIVQPRGTVRCKNIKDDCPKPACQHPVLLPGRCCKICPDSPENDFESNFSFRPKGQVTGLYSDDQQETFTINEFRALLVGRDVRGGSVRTTSVAVIHITAHRGELRYAVRYSKLDRPKFLQITDANGYVLLDTAIVKRRKRDKKLCGVWQKIPAVYVQYLRQGRLFAVVTSSKHPKGLVAGRIVPNDMATTEVFSSVLSSPKPEGAGGLVSLQYNPSRRLVHYVILVEGLVQVGLGADYHVTISKGKRVLHQAAASTTPLTTKISGSWKLTKRRERKQLARGRLRMYVTSHNGAVITGIIYPRLMCGVFQALLSGSNALQSSEAPSAGSAILELGPSGGLHYKIRVLGLQSAVTRIRLEGSGGRRKHKSKQRIVGNLHRNFVADNSSFDGWANGTYKKLDAKAVHNLLNDKLYVSVVTGRPRGITLSGRLVPAPYIHTLKNMDAPTTLLPVTPEAGGGAAHAWLSMHPGCALRYDAVLAGRVAGNEVEETGGSFSVLLGSYQNRLRRTFLLGPQAGHVITSQFQYNVSTGSVRDVPQGMLRDLDEGHAYLQVISGPGDSAVFRANVTLPNTCWQYVRDPDSSLTLEEQAARVKDAGDVCVFEGSPHAVGDSWLPDVNSTCYTCSCMRRGSPVCHRKMCPPLSCDHPVKLDDQCCPTCPEETWSQHCRLDNDPRRYPLHHTWYPFLPLKGFAKCAVCVCKEGNEVECSREVCPRLHCPGHELVRLGPDDCCPVCGPKLEEDTSELDRPQLDINMEGACSFNGRWKTQGETWHPRVKPFGQLKCFLCRCHEGKSECGRTLCPGLNCARKIRQKGSCCDECDSDQPEEDGAIPGSTDSKGGCSFGGQSYPHRAKWRPPASPNGDTRCARCRCKNGRVNCKIRCPKKCKTDRNYSQCCRHCPEGQRATGPKDGEPEPKDKRPAKGRTSRKPLYFPLT